MTKVAVISGASRGLGKSLAENLAGQGYHLALASRTTSDLEELKSKLESDYNIQVLTQGVDFAKKNEVIEFSEAVKNTFTNVHVIVNNVGIYGGTTVSQMDDGELEQMMNVNFYGAYYLTKAFLEQFKLRKSGHVFNICSIVNRVPRVATAAYTISKDALYSFNSNLREEMRDYGVKVTAVLPGAINTSSWEGSGAPLNEMVQPEDIANAVQYALNLSPNAYLEEIVIRQMKKDL